MAAFFFVNAMQVDFESVLSMENIGMAKMFKSLRTQVIRGFGRHRIQSMRGTKQEKGNEDGIPFAKEMCANSGSFDMVTSEKFDLMVAISAGLKVNCAQLLLQVLLGMVNNPKRQSQGFVVQVSVLLEKLVKADLGGSVKLHPQKMLTSKSVQTYIKKNLDVKPAGETSKLSVDATGADGPEAKLEKIIEMEERVDNDPYNMDEHMEDANQTTKERQGGNASTIAQGELDISTACGPETYAEIEDWVDHIKQSMQEKSSDKTQEGDPNTERAIVKLLWFEYADNQQQLVDELAFVKSQFAEMIDCMKELHDAKKGKVVQ
ncbi:hypothetical protein F511_20332 [Dorcoceras hygrometricum]|uniref:Uncharacterized protein n=1 Tax=Dorcoceras hygrometricum TaxID=472368 RepID=A0A2Z7DF21_9LAMI|nr:hypothetical protein F511_20332 [Dorcoceras hygrometricum]